MNSVTRSLLNIIMKDAKNNGIFGYRVGMHFVISFFTNISGKNIVSQPKKIVEIIQK